MANVLWNLVQNEDSEILRYCCRAISHHGLDFVFLMSILFCFTKSNAFSLGSQSSVEVFSWSRSVSLLFLSFVSAARHDDQPSVVSVIPPVLRLIPIHGAFHGFDPVPHIHFIFLPFLLGLENHFTLPQFL